MSENLSRFLIILFISLSVTMMGLVLITTEVGRSEIQSNSTYLNFSKLMSFNNSVKSRYDSLNSGQMKVKILLISVWLYNCGLLKRIGKTMSRRRFYLRRMCEQYSSDLKNISSSYLERLRYDKKHRIMYCENFKVVLLYFYFIKIDVRTWRSAPAPGQHISSVSTMSRLARPVQFTASTGSSVLHCTERREKSSSPPASPSSWSGTLSRDSSPLIWTNSIENIPRNLRNGLPLALSSNL